MKWLNRLRCELQDHIRVTEDESGRSAVLGEVAVFVGSLLRTTDTYSPDWYGALNEVMYWLSSQRQSVTRCTRCGWTSRRMDG